MDANLVVCIGISSESGNDSVNAITFLQIIDLLQVLICFKIL
jgi:hypothetical protein